MHNFTRLNQAHQPKTQSKRLDFINKSGRVGGSDSVFPGPADCTLCTDFAALGDNFGLNIDLGISHIGHP